MEKKDVSEMKKKDFKRLGKAISKLTCKGFFWGKDGAIALEKERLKILSQYDLELFIKITNYEKCDFLISLLSAASSTYYAAHCNAIAIAEKAAIIYKPLWYWRAWISLRSASNNSDRFGGLVSLQKMTLKELGLRSIILEKTNRLAEARYVLEKGIIRFFENKDTTCLLLIRESEVLLKLRGRRSCGNSLRQALELSKNEESVSLLTKAKVLTAYGKFLAEQKYLPEAEKALNSALELTVGNCLYEQTRKIKKTMRLFKLAIR